MRDSRGPLIAIRPRAAWLVCIVATLLTLSVSMSLASVATGEDESDHAFEYTEGSWEETATAGALGGTIREGTSNSAMADVWFEGNSIKWIARKGPKYGIAEVRFNGRQPDGDVDLYAPTYMDAEVVWEASVTEADGPQHIQISTTGRKNEESSGTFINIDGVELGAGGRLGTFPLPQDDAFTVLEDGVLASTSGVFHAGIPDDVRQGKSLTVRAHTEPTHGSLALNTADGSFTYRPNPGYHGTDAFKYSVIDAHNHPSDATATVTITVTPVAEYYDLAGENRFETAVDAALTGWPKGAETVVIATGENFPDALGGSALAGAYDAPLLLVNRDFVRAEVTDAIRRLGAKRAFVLGGKSAVSDNVMVKVRAAMGEGASVDRIPGANRYDTARRVAAEALDKLGDHDGIAFVATGASFPDALASGPISAYAGWPVYLVGADNAATIAEMTADGITSVKVLGGEKAVPRSTYEALRRAFPGKVSRIAGSDRYDTAARVAELAPSAGMTWEGTGIASGANFPDALAAGALLGRVRAPLLLTAPKSLSAPAMARLQTNRVEISDLRFFGGPSALSAAVRTSAKRAVEAP